MPAAQSSVLALALAALPAPSPAQSVPPVSPPTVAPGATPQRAPGGYRPAPQPSVDPRRAALRHRLLGLGWSAVAVTGLMTTTVLQARAAQGKRTCLETADGSLCPDLDGPGRRGIHAAGLTVFTTASFASMFAFGRGQAYDDFVEGSVKRRAVGAVIAGVVWLGYAQGLLVSGAVVQAQRRNCRDAKCRYQKMVRGYVLTDLGALMAGGAFAVMGYGLGRAFQGRRLHRFQVAPALTTTQAGLTLTGTF